MTMIADQTPRPTSANPQPVAPRYALKPTATGAKRYDTSQIAAVKLALRNAKYTPALADGEAARIAKETGVGLHMVRMILKGARGQYVELLDDETPAPTPAQ